MAATINDSLGIVDTVSGVDIHATKDGKFAAIVNGIKVELASKAAVTRRLQALDTPLAVMRVISATRSPQVHQAVRVTRAKQIIYLAEKSWPKGEYVEQGDRLHGWYFYDEAAHAQLTAIAEQVRALEAQQRAILRGLTAVTVASWGEAQISAAAAAAEQPDTAE